MSINIDTSNLAGRLAPLYCKYSGQTNEQPAYIEMAENGDVTADYSGETGNAVPADVWHKRALRWGICAQANGDALAEFLRRDDVVELFKRVHRGHSVDWNGKNFVGWLDDDAQSASNELQEMINRTFDPYDDGYCVRIADAEIWIESAFSIRDLITSGSVAAYASVMEPDESDNVMIDGSLRRAVAEMAARKLRTRNDSPLNMIIDDEARAAAKILAEYDSDTYGNLLNEDEDD